MKRYSFILIAIVLIVGIFFYMRLEGPQSDPTVARYSNQTSGISFTYPKILQASTTDAVVTLHHEIPFEHHDYCDFKGEATTTIPLLTDFQVSFETVEKNLVDTMHKVSPYIPEENFVNNEVIPSPGFIDAYTVGTWNGYKIFEGAEGCGHTIYYFRVSSDKTLVVTQQFITIFSGAIDADQGTQALLVPGVISKEKEQEILTGILQTVKVK